MFDQTKRDADTHQPAEPTGRTPMEFDMLKPRLLWVAGDSQIT
jgi:hypothetical protein